MDQRVLDLSLKIPPGSPATSLSGMSRIATLRVIDPDDDEQPRGRCLSYHDVIRLSLPLLHSFHCIWIL